MNPTLKKRYLVDEMRSQYASGIMRVFLKTVIAIG